MKVILSVDAVKFPLTGIGRYVHELAKRLERKLGIGGLEYFKGGRFCACLPDENVIERRTIAGVKGLAMKMRVAVALYSIISSFRQKKELAGKDDWLFHGPNFYLPKFPGRSIATVHDISVCKWAKCHPPERVRYMISEIKKTLKRADVLITDSEYTRQEVASYFNYPLGRIKSVPLASSEQFYPRTNQSLAKLKQKFQLLPDGYVLFVGTIEPRKNIQGLMDAYEMMPLKFRRRWPLVIAGYRGWQSDQIHQRIKKAEIQGWSRYLGFVSTDDLPLLFAGARLFVFPSLYEGFGLPVLEAMASGTPVVCSNSSSLPEVAGTAVAMFDVQDIDKLSLLIQEGVGDERWRRKAITAGLDQARKFSWEKCASETISVYKAVMQL